MSKMYSTLQSPLTLTTPVWPNFPRPRRRLTSVPALTRFCAVAGVLTLLFTAFLLSQSSKSAKALIPPALSSAFRKPTSEAQLLEIFANATSEYGPHPINDLIADALRKQDALLKMRSTDLRSAAARYRVRRGRHPPPGFDKWFEYASKHDAVIVESFFDRIYKDLLPFWALDSWQTAKRAADWEHVVRVRSNKAIPVGDVTGKVPWLQLWTDLVAEFAEFLPDVDMPINYMDESRILVPWEDIGQMVENARMWRKITPVDDVVSDWHGLRSLHGDSTADAQRPYEPVWLTDTEQIWDYTAATCPPDSPGRNASALEDFSLPPVFPENWDPDFSEGGYVKNHTAAMDPCYQPHLRGLHSTFVEPISMRTTQELIPLFGGSKLSRNNEILIPGAMYLTADSFYSGGNWHGPSWDQKTTSVTWRGVASGGRHKDTNWRHFQRLRLIEMLNGTTVQNLEENAVPAMTFQMPPADRYDFLRRFEGEVGGWLSETTDAGFTELLCFPREGNCSYLSEFFHEVAPKPMDKQFQHKFIPDVDGNSFSARYRGLLLSTSLPIKATIYAEWHDDRLQPWLHFAPMDNTLQDLYGILDYFMRDDKGDAAARLIAETGKRWGEMVLRREDTVLYVWRLLLEFARVCDENRDRLGWVDDLTTMDEHQ
ncbi:family 90 glycosyltransferase [Cryphonectria parasitica EP155]|uniref:Family 90 glycosyltransferase n=1 Tax=Cryphonectria parasitica (strain ATCC 38755 / EP155) TaxID=660469 RepID=A0A9P4XVM2_CRYP1|nr:family 90 glycosyltransferase [Cryphonectria parasitica EP155]KAF3761651.1 family 90 glycosyltransferase [Cryphonectria parasitica EP155]